MRKTQAKLIEKAKKANFPDVYIEILSDESYTIKQLDSIYGYFYKNKDCEDPSLYVQEVIFQCEYMNSIKNKTTKQQLESLEAWLLPQYVEDVLIGSKKKQRYFKMMCFINNKLKEEGQECDVRHELILNYLYRHLLNRQTPTWLVNEVLRKIFLNPPKAELVSNIFTFDKESINDFLHKKKESVLYYFITRDIKDQILKVDISELHGFYDKNRSCYSIEGNEYEKIFTIVGDKIKVNKEYLDAKILENNGMLKIVYSFVQEKELKTADHGETIFKTYYKYALSDEANIKKINECASILNSPFKTNMENYSLYVNMKNTGFINITYREYKSIKGGIEEFDGWRAEDEAKVRTLVIAPDGRLYKELYKKNNLRPLSFREFYFLYMNDNVLSELLHRIFDCYASLNPFYKDVLSDCKQIDEAVMPLSFNEVMNYHNRAELIKTKYKTAEFINVKWNKRNIHISYMLIKSFAKAQYGTSRNILVQQQAVSLLEKSKKYRNLQDKIIHFLSAILLENIKTGEIKNSSVDVKKIKKDAERELYDNISTNLLPNEIESFANQRLDEQLNSEDLVRTTEDYIKMCFQNKEKVRLNVYSIRQMYNLHDRISSNKTNYEKNTGEVKVPKNSQFNELREILPENFEWIKTRKRLILETELQNHCVWSYAYAITADKCAIYSFIDINGNHSNDRKPKRYTIEFIRRKGKYIVNQVQGKNNKANSKEMEEYIQSILDECERKKGEKNQNALHNI